MATALAAVVLGAWSVYQITVWPARRALPWGSEVLEERVLVDGLLPDFDYTLRVRIDRARYILWIQRLGFVPCQEGREYCAPHPNETATWDNGVATYSAWDD